MIPPHKHLHFVALTGQDGELSYSQQNIYLAATMTNSHLLLQSKWALRLIRVGIIILCLGLQTEQLCSWEVQNASNRTWGTESPINIVEHWNHVSGVDNPADCVCSPQNFLIMAFGGKDLIG